MLAHEELRSTLEQAGVSPVPAGTGFRGRIERAGRALPLVVRVSENWLHFSMPGGVPAPESERERRALHDRLLRLNRELALAKFCLDEAGAVVVTVELPTESLNDTEVRDALEALASCAATLPEA